MESPVKSRQYKKEDYYSDVPYLNALYVDGYSYKITKRDATMSDV